MAKTIAETVDEIRFSLRDYVEATYHVGHPVLVAQRRACLDEEGVLFRAPYIESTPRYKASRRFADLEIPSAAQHLLNLISTPGTGRRAILYDPPYTHQASALEATTRDGKSLVVTTGTGSGKTETFLLPILAKLAIEAQHDPQSFATPALRAILLYPMNALVNDQLGRLRLLFGDPRVAGAFTSWAGRPARFARYTSRTLYPGVRTAKKDSAKLQPIQNYYISLLERAADAADPDRERAARLVQNLQERGKWPAKPDLQRWFGRPGQRWQNSAGEFVRAIMQDDDPELLTRHEVLTSPPDVLVTNYSMLEYMLMRPLERPVFEATRSWLRANPAQRLLLVVDEAHLYRGAAGAEVGLLLRRLRARLDIPAERLQVICTSASYNDLPAPVTAAEGDLDALAPGRWPVHLLPVTRVGDPSAAIRAVVQDRGAAGNDGCFWPQINMAAAHVTELPVGVELLARLIQLWADGDGAQVGVVPVGCQREPLEDGPEVAVRPQRSVLLRRVGIDRHGRGGRRGGRRGGVRCSRRVSTSAHEQQQAGSCRSRRA